MLETLFSHARSPPLSFGSKSDEVLNLEQVWDKVGLGTPQPLGLVEQEDWYRQVKPKNIEGFERTQFDELQVVNEGFNLISRAIDAAPQLVDFMISVYRDIKATQAKEKENAYKQKLFQMLGMDEKKQKWFLEEIGKLDKKYRFSDAVKEITKEITEEIDPEMEPLGENYEAAKIQTEKYFKDTRKQIEDWHTAKLNKSLEKQKTERLKNLEKRKEEVLEDLEKEKNKKEFQTLVLLMANKIVKEINAKITLSYELQRELESLKNKIVQVILDNVNLFFEVKEKITSMSDEDEQIEFLKKLCLQLFKANKSLLIETVAFLKVLATEVVKRGEPLKISATAQPGSHTRGNPIVSTFTNNNRTGGASQADIDLLNALSYEQNRLNSVNAMIGGKYMK
jgi:hypothetical protein